MQTISRQALERLPLYLNFLKSLPSDTENISATAVAQAMGLGEVQVRKDLAAVSASGGKPKVGYLRHELIRDVEEFLGYHNADTAVIVGAGHLGRALLTYDGFAAYGLDIVAAFDSDFTKLGIEPGGKRIFPLSRLEDLCERMAVRIGIIAVPAVEAQRVADMMVEAGVLAIWNFAPIHLRVPDEVLVQNENMAVSLAVLSQHLTEKLEV